MATRYSFAGGFVYSDEAVGLRGDLFSANILAPHRDTLLFSDSFIGQALLAIPLRLAGVGWATLYNTLLLLAG